ncbi:MAG: hypothetical protein AB8G15_00955 [Saprospiraceae bacterium]
MGQLKLYKYAAGILLLLNLSMLAFFFFTKPPHHHGRGPMSGGQFKGRALEILNLETAQHDHFLSSAKAHNQSIEAIRAEQRVLLKPYFESIADTTKKVDKAKVLAQIETLERRKIEKTYEHFTEVKNMLHPEQKANFPRFMNSALEKVLFKPKPPRRKPH